jgi:hypothetical protein
MFLAGVALTLLATASLSAQGGPAAKPAPPGPRGAEISFTGTYPELRVDGEPFFVHSAAFFYYRLPRDLWERSLEAHRALGINTLDLAIPWNWHELRPGEFDFEGSTHARRDLRGLLKLITEKGFKLIARPGGTVDRQWKNAGWPEWLPADGDARREAHRRWLTAVARVLAPFSARSGVRVPDEARRNRTRQEKEVSGPLILMALGSTGYGESGYLTPAQQALEAGGLAGLPFLPGAPAWLLRAPAANAASSEAALTIPRRFDAAEAATLAHAGHRQRPLPDHPPLLLEYQAGWAAPAEDVRPPETAASDTLISSRLFLSQGAGGLSYFPLQDTLTPAGWEGESGNRYFRWDAALDINGGRQARARAVLRNGQLLDTWRRFLGGAHRRADFGVVLPAGAGAGAVRRFLQLERVAALAGLTLEAVDPSRQPVEQLLRNGVTLVLAPGKPDAEALADYQRQGGSVVEVSEELYSWAKTEVSLSAAAAHPDAAGATEALHGFLRQAGQRPVVRRARTVGSPLLISQLVTNAGTGPLGERTRESGGGLLSVTNLGDEAVEEELEILSPRVSARAAGSGALPLRIAVPPGDSLMLPLNAPLCSAPRTGHECTDEIVAAGAELLRAERDGKELLLTMYVPTRATLRLRLERQPSRTRVDEVSPEGLWTVGTRQFEVTIQRGPAPDYIRLIKIQLPYEPYVPKKPDPDKTGRKDYDWGVTDAARLPLASDAALVSDPPLIILKGDRTGRMIVEATNYDVMPRQVEVKVEGPIRGQEGVSMDPGEHGFDRMDLRPAPGNGEPRGTLSEGACRGTAASTPASPGDNPCFVPLLSRVEARSGSDRRSGSIAFVPVEEEKVTPYEFDFDRDGAAEWVLEDERLRIVNAPESGGRILALVDRESGLSLTNALGALRDEVASRTSASTQDVLQLYRLPYRATWLKEEKTTVLRLEHAAPGLHVQKTLRITGPQKFEADYKLRAAAGEAGQEWDFTTATAAPVVFHGQHTSRICWGPAAAQAEAASSSAPQKPADSPPAGAADDMTCETFVPGKALDVPAGARRLEVRTPGSFALRLEWPAGRMRVEMHRYTAMLKLRFPALAAGAETSYKLAFSAAVVE